MYGWVAIGISSALFLGLSAWAILLLVLGTQESLQILRNLFSIKSLRQASRFRLRSLVLFVAIVQVLLATVVWYRQQGGEAGVLLYAIGCGTFFAWLIWFAFEDAITTTASRRWKRIVRAKRLRLPADAHPLQAAQPPEPPLPGCSISPHDVADNRHDGKV